MITTFIFSLIVFACFTQKPRKIILDFDPGSDDALALIWLSQAVREGAIELLAVTTIGGNLEAVQCCTNAFRLVQSLGLSNTIVGCNLEDEPKSDDYYSGDGLNGASQYLHDAPLPSNLPSASEVLRQTVEKYPDEITLMVAGPLTNIAELFRHTKRIKEIVIMGGALEGGNVTPYAEFNFWSDGKSAELVFSSGYTNFVLFPLDVTMSVCAENQFDELSEVTNLKSGGKGEDMLKFLQDSMFSQQARQADIRWMQKCRYVHDAMTTAYILDPYLFTFERLKISVNDAGEVRGRQDRLGYFQPNTWVATTVNEREFWMSMRRNILKLILSLEEEPSPKKEL